MCVAVPLRLIEKNDKDGVCEMDSVKRHVRLDLVPKVKTGEYVIVHAGFAIEILKEEQALENLEAIHEDEEALKEDKCTGGFVSKNAEV